MTLAYECLPDYPVGRHFRGRGRGLEVPTPLELTNQHLDLATSLATSGPRKRCWRARMRPRCSLEARRKEQCGSTQPRREYSLRSRPGRSPPPGVARPPREAAEPCKMGGEFRGPRRQKSLQKAILPLMYCLPQTPLSPFSLFLQPLEEPFLRKFLHFRKGCGPLF